MDEKIVYALCCRYPQPKKSTRIEKSSMPNETLNDAMRNKEDEFYTQLSDVADELRHYRHHFYGKTVLCNCDDPYESNFFKYFALNFNALGLKKLIATCFDGSPMTGREFVIQLNFDETGAYSAKRKAYKVEITEVPDVNGDGVSDLSDVEWLLKNDNNVLTVLKGTGDFRSDECVELLKEADIVCTNPPFSLFGEYITQLLESGKRFLIIGNQNAITYKTVFPYLKDNRMWLGYGFGDMSFKVPEYYPPRKSRYWVDQSGQKWRSHGNICWYTNLDIRKRHEEFIAYKHYTPQDYPKYDNFDAIEVGHTANIPCDYDGPMGVPITFLDKYNPSQFEILGHLGSYAPDGYSLCGAIYLNGKKKFKRILIRKKETLR